jgi:hypothetical protein
MNRKNASLIKQKKIKETRRQHFNCTVAKAYMYE